MRVIVIGGTGHIGSYLVPRLVSAGHAVVCVSRGERAPYFTHPAWDSVESVRVDRDAEETHGVFGQRIAALDPDVVVDLTCFTVGSAAQLVEALRPRHDAYLVHCGTVWVHGFVCEVPVREDAKRRPFGAYGIGKAAAEEFLLAQSRGGGVPVTVLHPGHIVGPGWAPIGPAGNRDPDVLSALAGGRAVTLPNLGLETLHHVHADDVAQAFERAVAGRDRAVGESFHIASERAITLRGYAEALASWFGQEARLDFAPLASWEAQSSEHAIATVNHVQHSTNVSIDKARQVLGYSPRYTSLQAVAESVRALIDRGELDASQMRPPR